MDTADTVPDGVDEDCDGKVDEDVDATRARCPYGMRVIEGTRGNDTIHGTRGPDCILGYGGNDTIYGEAGDDLIFGGPGDDRIYTGRGNAIVHGGAGNDTIDTSGSLLSTAYGEAGNDTLIGGGGLDSFFGGDDNDKINGGGGPDILSGGGCHDYIVGGPSFDIANGGSDVDACDVELSSDCEKSARSRKLCKTDADCAASDRCAVFSGFCVSRSAKACGATNNPPGCVPTSEEDNDCNGNDDDCDGMSDEDFPVEPTTCGQGSCRSTGETSCVNGQVVDSCMASGPNGTDMVCNGVDDDCDGRIDEGFVSAPTTCGLGVCAATGTTACVNGAVVNGCVPGAPAATSDTLCNNLDDDCDGASDEDFVPLNTTCGAGQCASTGVTSCVNGMLENSCEAGEPPVDTDTTCDGIDDDCNGEVDDGFLESETSCGFGACATTGATVCENGQIVDTCHVTCEGNCADGSEDDGDGLVDCSDPDCQNKPDVWPQCAPGEVGSPCTSSADCRRPTMVCETGFPGGYCFEQCGPNNECPNGSFCLMNAVCVQPCVGPDSDSCPRAGNTCAPLVVGSNDTPFCRPNCEMSCASGSCDPATLTCI